MEEFKKDLIELFNKHGLLVLKDSVIIEHSPLYVTHKGNTRFLTFKFEQFLPQEEADEHRTKYGAVIDGFDSNMKR